VFMDKVFDLVTVHCTPGLNLERGSLEYNG